MNLTIFKRLALGNIVILLFVIFLGGFITSRLNTLHQVTRDIVMVDGTNIRRVEDLLSTINTLVVVEKKYLVSRDPDYYQRFQEMKTDFLKALKGIENRMDTKEKKESFFLVKESCDSYITKFEKQAAMTDQAAGGSTDSDFLTARTHALKCINEYLNRINRLNLETRNDKILLSSRMSKQAMNMTAFISVLTILLSILITTFNTRSITRSISLLKVKTKEIAKGRFEEIPPIHAPKEIQELAGQFNRMCLRLGELDALKADFISHVSHELRTPLTAIKEACNMLFKGLYAHDIDKQNELYTLIQEECDRLLNSVIKILDLSRMEADEMEYDFETKDLTLIIRRSILKLAPLARKKSIDLEFIPPPPELPQVIIDEERIGQVLDNLISNAIKFTPVKGAIIIKTSFNKEMESAMVSVSDNGCGIKDENLEEIFNKFKQIDSGVKTRRGTGLGLSISKYIIRAHGGKIWAESDYSLGTNVSFILPAA